MTKLTIKVIDRDNFSWGVWDEEEKTFIKMYQTKSEAEEGMAEIVKEREEMDEIQEDTTSMEEKVEAVEALETKRIKIPKKAKKRSR